MTGPGPASLPPTALRALARRHGITPTKSLGQNFLVDPALARRIAQLSEAGPGDRVLEIGAGLGSLTLALAATGASVTAVEVDRRLIPALTEVTAGWPDVRVVRADAMRASWASMLEGEPWALVANLPYNVATPVVLRVLQDEPRVRRMLVMVQREVGERLAASPGAQAVRRGEPAGRVSRAGLGGAARRGDRLLAAAQRRVGAGAPGPSRRPAGRGRTSRGCSR